MTDDSRCAAGDRCVGYDPSKKVALQLVDPSRVLCEPCLRAGQQSIGQLVYDYRDLEQMLPPAMGVWGDGQPRGSAELRVPMRLPVEELQAEIRWIVTAWEAVVRDVDNLSAEVTKGVRGGWAVQAAVRILEPRIELLARIEPVEMAEYPNLDQDEVYRLQLIEHAKVPGWRGVRDFDRLHSRARWLLGLTAAQPEHCHGVPCKDIECDEKELYRELGGDGVFCASCGKRYSPAEYDAWVRLVHGHVKPRGER